MSRNYRSDSRPLEICNKGVLPDNVFFFNFSFGFHGFHLKKLEIIQLRFN